MPEKLSNDSSNGSEQYKKDIDMFTNSITDVNPIFLRVEKQSAGDEVYFVYSVTAADLGIPSSNTKLDIDQFMKEFKERHARAFELLSPNVKVCFEVKIDQTSKYLLTLYC